MFLTGQPREGIRYKGLHNKNSMSWAHFDTLGALVDGLKRKCEKQKKTQRQRKGIQQPDDLVGYKSYEELQEIV